MKGKLFIVPTPIGNLGDMTFRAIETLKNSDAIFCEDTRQSRKLLDFYQIDKKLSPLHKINEYKIVENIVGQIKSGQVVSLISDAGTPVISDPGNLLITLSIQEGIEVDCLPGSTAFVPALVNSGFDLSQFVFVGFPPHKKGRKTFIENIGAEKRTVVLYESPYRVLKFLEEFKEYVNTQRQISISREISKKFEETIRGNADELISHYKKKEPKGEFVIVISNV